MKDDNQFLRLIDDFDFDKIHAYMKLVNWQWGTSKTEDKIPTAIELRNQLIGMLDLAWEAYVDPTNYDKTYENFMGGFNVTWIKTNENELDKAYACFELVGDSITLKK